MKEHENNELPMHVRLKSLRAESGLTAAQLGEKLGNSRQLICDTQNGRKFISHKKAKKWAEACGFEMLESVEFRQK